MECVERNHFSHRHKLRRYYSELIYECNGCHQDVIGHHFGCHSCGFILHTQCAETKLTYGVHKHRFYGDCQFEFAAYPPQNSSRLCSACKQEVEGFVFNCSCGYNLHPCCAALPPEIKLDNGQWLDLQPKELGPCNHCGEITNSWCYVSGMRKYNFHVACVMKMWLELGEDDHHRKWKEKVKKGWEKVRKYWKKGLEMGGELVADELLRMIISAVLAALLGDPTALLQWI